MIEKKENLKYVSKNFRIKIGPHIKTRFKTETIMWLVILALTPAAIASIYFFGIDSLFVILVSISSAILTESIIQRLRKKSNTIYDGSAILTGLLLAMCLPSTTPLWIAGMGAFFAISIGKMAFGGLGNNIFNPALIGRAFVVASWPALVSRYIWPDGSTGATPLAIWKMQGASEVINYFGEKFFMYKSLFFGNVAGSIGETSAILLLLGALFLFTIGILEWRIPVFYIGTMIVLSVSFGEDWIFQVLAGGLILGAFFMATDYVTSPTTKNGRIIFGIGCGILTFLFRMYSGMPEGVCYAILCMNAFVPLIDRWTIPKSFGFKKKISK